MTVKKSVIKMRYTRLESYIRICYDAIFIKILVVHSEYWLILSVTRKHVRDRDLLFIYHFAHTIACNNKSSIIFKR